MRLAGAAAGWDVTDACHYQSYHRLLPIARNRAIARNRLSPQSYNHNRLNRLSLIIAAIAPQSPAISLSGIRLVLLFFAVQRLYCTECVECIVA
jgi:hypothetical protein